MTSVQVEGTIFRVHRYFLDRECSDFPRTTNRADGVIELEGVTQLEFESLLDLFYEGYVYFLLICWIQLNKIPETRMRCQCRSMHGLPYSRFQLVTIWGTSVRILLTGSTTLCHVLTRSGKWFWLASVMSPSGWVELTLFCAYEMSQSVLKKGWSWG